MKSLIKSSSFLLKSSKPVSAILSKTIKPIVQQKPLPSLATCIALDIIGSATYAVPILGELVDFIWAPISAVIYWRLFGFKKGFLGGMFSFVEEIMPGLDFIPTFTITWAILYFKKNKATFSLKKITG